MILRATLLALLLASSAMGAQGEAISFDQPLQCGKHLLPPSVCYPMEAFQVMDAEVRRLQAVEQDAKAAGDRRLIFFATGAILGAITGLLLGGYIAWTLLR